MSRFVYAFTLILVFGFGFLSGGENFESFKTSSVSYLESLGLPQSRDSERERFDPYLFHQNLFRKKPSAVLNIGLQLGLEQQKTLSDVRRKAISSGYLRDEESRPVDGMLRFGRKRFLVEVKIAPGRKEVLGGDSWPLAIRVLGGALVSGMASFNLYMPSKTGFQKAALFNQWVRDLGGISPETHPVHFKLNGRSQGIVFLEEAYSSEFLKSKDRRAGVILGWDSSDYWKLRNRGFSGESLNEKNSRITVYSVPSIVDSDDVDSQLATAVGLLRGMVEGSVSPEQVFDYPAMAKFWVSSMLWRNESAVNWRNIRLYFNPVTFLFEPVVSSVTAMTEDSGSGESDVGAFGFFDSDLRFKAVLLDTRKELRKKFLDEEYRRKLAHLQDELLLSFRRSYPLLTRLKTDELLEDRIPLQENQKPQFESVRFAQKERTPWLEPDVRIVRDSRGYYLEVLNKDSEVIEVLSVSYDDPEVGGRPDARLFEKERSIESIQGTEKSAGPILRRWVLRPNLTEIQLASLKVLVRNPKRSRIFAAKPYSYFPALSANPFREKSEYASKGLKRRYLKFDPESGELRVLKGRWKVLHSIVVPAGIKLVVPKGTRLIFETNAALISYGPVEIIGSSKEPIYLGPLRRDEGWPGVAVIQAKGWSKIVHTRIKGVRGLRQGEWVLRGGVNFYESDVKVAQTRIEGVSSQSALSIVRSRFALVDSRLEDTQADGLSLEYAEGIIVGGHFRNIGRDGVESVGSILKAEKLQLEGVRERAFSMRQKSHMDALGIQVRDAADGLMSRDSSSIILVKSRFRDVRNTVLETRTGIDSGEKSRILAKRIRLKDVGEAVAAEKGTELRLNGRNTPTR